MIGKLETVVLDTRDPHGLAEFYRQVLGAKTHVEKRDWVTIVDEDGRKLSFQTSPEHESPTFPDPAGDQQFHLDIRVGADEVDEAERRLLELGATRVPDAIEDSEFRVFRDPAGHPFCLVWD